MHCTHLIYAQPLKVFFLPIISHLLWAQWPPCLAACLNLIYIEAKLGPLTASLRRILPWLGPIILPLTHISRASFLWNKGKQFRTRSDGAFCGIYSAYPLFAHIMSFKIWIKLLKYHPKTLTTKKRLVQLMRDGNSIILKWVIFYLHQSYIPRNQHDY